VNDRGKHPFYLGGLAAVLACGCYSAQLDPDLVGVFACDRDDDSPCPGEQACINSRCEDAALAPALAVITPEDEQALTRDDLDMMLGMPLEPIPLDVVIQASLELVPASPDDEGVFGQGYVKVFVDGVEQRTLESGSFETPDGLQVMVPPMAGPHRIMLEAHRSDGLAYDNPEATVTQLFWFRHQSELLRRPFVAIKSPAPMSVFDTEEQPLTVELATLDFMLREPGGPIVEGEGHAHVAHDTRLPYPECVMNPECDNVYLPDGLVGSSKSAEVTLPASEAGSDELTAVLRKPDHSPYLIPFECVLGPDMPQLCVPVFETIEIVRIAAD